MKGTHIDGAHLGTKLPLPVSRRSTSDGPAGRSLRLAGQQIDERGPDDRGNVMVRRVAHHLAVRGLVPDGQVEV
jgi:hypothetical protein